MFVSLSLLPFSSLFLSLLSLSLFSTLSLPIIFLSPLLPSHFSSISLSLSPPPSFSPPSLFLLPPSFSLSRILPLRVLLNGILRGRSQVMSSSLRIRSKGGSHCIGLVKLTLSMMLRLGTVKDSLLWQLYYYCRFVLPSLSLSLSLPFYFLTLSLSFSSCIFLLYSISACLPISLLLSFIFLHSSLSLLPLPPPTLSPLTPPLPLYV